MMSLQAKREQAEVKPELHTKKGRLAHVVPTQALAAKMESIFEEIEARLKQKKETIVISDDDDATPSKEAVIYS